MMRFVINLFFFKKRSFITIEKQWVDVCARVYFLFFLSLRRPKMENSEIKLQLCSNQSKHKLRKKKHKKTQQLKNCKNLFVSLFYFDISFRLDIEQIDFHLWCHAIFKIVKKISIVFNLPIHLSLPLPHHFSSFNVSASNQPVWKMNFEMNIFEFI